MSDLERVSPPKIGGTLPHDANIEALHSIAVSLKRIADMMAEMMDGTSDRLSGYGK